jgi:hypothetical protein
LAISIRSGEGKVSILFVLLAITPKTHLIILEGRGAAVPRKTSSPRAVGITPILLPQIDIDRIGRGGRGRGESFVCFASCLTTKLELTKYLISCYPFHPSGEMEATERFNISRNIPLLV